MKSVGIFEAKSHFTALCDEVLRTGEPTLVSKRGKPLVLVTPVPAAIDSGHEDILFAWQQWERDHPGDAQETDFPEVWQTRIESKPNPLAEE